MKINVKLDLDDRERDSLADYIDGKQSKRLATRKDINEFVNGCLNAAVYVVAIYDTDAEIERLRKAGHDDSYIRGWIQVGDRICNKA